MFKLNREMFTEPYDQFSEHDEITLNKICSNATGLFCEIGCWTGHSTSILAQRVKDTGNKLIVIDSFKGNEFTPLFSYAMRNDVESIFIKNMKELGLWENINLIKMDSALAVNQIENESLSLLFVDAGHIYNDIKSDLLNYISKVKKGGLICGHDYESETYEEAYIDEDYVNGKHHGVIKAVNEVIGKVNHEGRMWWVDN